MAKTPQPAPIHQHHWLTQVRRTLLAAFAMIAFSLTIGVLGYYYIGGLDSLLEASMILGGEGPIAPMHNENVKLFASLYGLYSGLVLLTTTGVLLAPWLHNMIYRTHRQARRDAKAEETHLDD